jgi:hypothetical protein
VQSCGLRHGILPVRVLLAGGFLSVVQTRDVEGHEAPG